MQMSEGREFQAKGIVSAKALSQGGWKPSRGRAAKMKRLEEGEDHGGFSRPFFKFELSFTPSAMQS